MANNILITRQEFLNEFNNGVGFGTNPLDFTFNLAGSVGENIKAIREIDVSWIFTASTNNPLAGVGEISPGLLRMQLSTGRKWRDEGFAVGDTILITWTDNAGAQNNTGTISSLTNNVMLVTWSGYPLPGNINGWINNSTTVYGTAPLTAQVYTFGLVDNGETSVDPESKVSGNDQGYYGANIGFDTGGGIRDTNFVTLNRLGPYKDWQTGSMQTRFVSNPLILFGSPVSQRFEIHHEFTIVPYYLDGELTNLQNNIIPNDLTGQNSYKYVFAPGFRTVLSNPNTEKKIEYTDDLGSVAWFNENFNGFQNFYQVNSITYQEQATLANADGLLIGTKTRVTMVVQKNTGNFLGGDRVGVYVSQLPEQAEYENTTLTDLKENFLYDNAMGNAGLAGIAGQDFITNLTVFAPVGNLITLFFDVEYSPLQKAFLSNKNSNAPVYFLIGMQLGDDSIPAGNSDRVTILADVEVYDESPDIPNLMNVTKFDIYDHANQIGVGTGYTDLTGWPEDGVVIDYTFSLNRLFSAVLNTIEFQLIARNPNTGQLFELDSFPMPIAGAIVSNNIQQLIVNTTRGYILKSGDQFNDVTMNVGSFIVQEQFYNGRFAQKISWQDWLANLNVDTIFFDSTKPNDNLNFKASNYANSQNDYELHFAILANLDGVSALNVSGNTDYLFLSPPITNYDYEEDGNVTPVWSCQIQTLNDAVSPSVDLGGAILTGQNTLFRTTWTNSGGPVTSLANIWGINRIEETDQPGYDITEMSSLNDPAATQLLIPSSGTKLFVYLDSGNVVMECYIDGSQVAPGVNYNLSSRIHDTNFVPDGAKQKSPTGDNKQKDDNDFKVKAP